VITLRHEPDADASLAAPRLADAVGALLPGARERAELLPAVLSGALQWAGRVAADDSDAPELDRALKIASQAGAALFALVAPGHGPQKTLRLGDEPVRAAATGPRADAGPEPFRAAFLVAAICRDADALGILATTPLSALQAAASADECLLLRARALQTAWLRKPEALAAVDAALAAAAPDRARTTSPEQLRHEVLPELEALRALVMEDPRELNRTLERLLDGHRRFRGEGEARRDPAHLLSWGALGIAAMAHDRGMRLEAQSDYVPLRLVMGELDRSMPVMDLPVDQERPGVFVLCRMCGSTVAPRARSCAACGSDLAHSEPIVLTPEQLGSAERKPCVRCGESLLGVALRCPRCQAWQQEDDEGEVEPEEVALRPFPPEFQLHLVARVYEPSRVAALLPADPPDPDAALGGLRRAGLDIVRAGPARSRQAPEAAWELEVALRMEGDPGPATLQIWPASLSDVPGFDRGALGPGVAPGEAAVVVSARFGRDLLRDLHRLLRVVDAVAPDAIGVVDFATGRARASAWLREAAQSPVPPDPSELYAVVTARSQDGSRVWLHTQGLGRCGAFEIEALDVPGDAAEGFAELLDAAARRLIEQGETVPGEEQPIPVADGLSVCWVPSRWARDDVGEGGFGAVEEERQGFRGLSAALLACDADGTAPISTLASRLVGVTWPESALDRQRDGSAAQATMGRFKALRMAHAGLDSWQFLVRLRPGSGPEAAWFRVGSVEGDRVRASLVGDPGGTGLARGSSGTWGLDRVVDWEIERPEGRITPADALVEMLAARRGGARGLDADRRTPVVPERRGEAPTIEPQASLTPEELAAILGEPQFSWTPVLLSAVLPGSGHLWLGQRDRGLVFLAVGLVTVFGCGIVNAAAAYDVWARTKR
jgi:hypothetical protein